jgi:PAS domain S-box-containing protein
LPTNEPRALRAQAAASRPTERRDDLFERMVDGVRDYAIFMLDAQGHILTWNTGAQRIKGYRADEIIGKHFSVFYPQEAIDRGWPQYELETATRVGQFQDEGWRIRKDGSTFWANVLITPMRDDDGTLIGFSKVTRDLTERREQEERLQQSEERFRLLLEGVQDNAIIMLDPDGRVTSWNSGAQRILGYSATEVLGQPVERFHTEEDRANGSAAEELRTALANGRVTGQGWRVRKDGTRFWAEVALTALHDEQGRLRGYAKVTRDLSDQQRLESLQEQGRNLTEFLAMLAHELRNPLAPLRNSLTLMTMEGALPPRLGYAHGVMDRQLAQLTRLVDDLLDVSRVTRGKLRLQHEVVDLNAAAQGAIEATRALVEARRQELTQDLAPQPLRIYADHARITQVLVNLLNNAAKYTPERGRIHVASRADGADAVVSVRDNGMGIMPRDIDTVFELFAQGPPPPDAASGGLGIGLALSRRIAELHGGTLTARSAGRNQGSEFELRLKLLDESALADIGNKPSAAAS